MLASLLAEWQAKAAAALAADADASRVFLSVCSPPAGASEARALRGALAQRGVPAFLDETPGGGPSQGAARTALARCACRAAGLRDAACDAC
jgi:hypothetical protein